MLAMMTSVEPRALRPVARASDSAPVRPPKPASSERAEELADAGNADDGKSEQQQRRIKQRPQIHAETGHGKEHRAEESDDEAPEFAFDVLRQNGGLAHQHTGYKRAERGMHADQLGRQGHHQHDEQNGRDDGHLDGHIIVGPADDPGHQAAPDCEADGEKERRPRQAHAPHS